MGSHGIRNRSPHGLRMASDRPGKPGEPKGWSMVFAGVGFCLIVTLWGVLAYLIP